MEIPSQVNRNQLDQNQFTIHFNFDYHLQSFKTKIPSPGTD